MKMVAGNEVFHCSMWNCSQGFIHAGELENFHQPLLPAQELWSQLWIDATGLRIDPIIGLSIAVIRCPSRGTKGKRLSIELSTMLLDAVHSAAHFSYSKSQML